jgi:DNA-binding transcriptional MerR regulator
MSKLYQIHEFAELAGVTSKALYHYERLGLLKPRRTDAGYRLYREDDLARLEQIVALKFLGVPLKQIKAVLDREALALLDILRLQRKALKDKQVVLARAIRAIQVAEEGLESGKAAEPAILRKIIEVISMQNDIEIMKRYYGTPEAWERHRRYYEEGPSREWQELYRDIGEALGDDPASEKAQALADRWLTLAVRAYRGDPEVQTDSMTAWMDREHWPPAMKRRIAEFGLEEVTAFVEQAALWSRKKYFSDEAWVTWIEIRHHAAQNYSSVWQSQVDLFRDVEFCLGEDPAGEKAQTLGSRWQVLMDAKAGHDAGVRAGLTKAWAERRNWSASLRWSKKDSA